MSDAGNSTKIAFAHMLRGLAALVVVVFHLAQMFWTAPVVATMIGAPPLGPQPYWFTTIVEQLLPEAFLGHFGVALFFLISGFVIPFSLLERGRLQFAVARFFRLWPTYAVGLSATSLLVIACAAWFGQPRPFAWTTYWLQLGFIQDMTGVTSIDGIVWTLEIEVRFYVLMALLAGPLRGGRMWPLLACAVAFASLTFSASLLPGWLQSGGWPYDPLYGLTLTARMLCYMLIGTVFNFTYRGLVGWPSAGGAVALLGATFVAQWALGSLSADFNAGVIAYTAAACVFGAAYASRESLRVPAILNWLAEISYSLYVIHGVSGYVVMRIAWDLGAGLGTCIVIGVAFAFGAATLLNVVVEAPTRAFGHQLARRLGHATIESLPLERGLETPTHASTAERDGDDPSAELGNA